MNRTVSIVVVLAMTFLALAVCVRQTLEARDSLGYESAMILLSVEAAFGAAVVAVCVSLLLRRYFRKRKIIRTGRGEVAQQLRRLFSAVWS